MEDNMEKSGIEENEIRDPDKTDDDSNEQKDSPETGQDGVEELPLTENGIKKTKDGGDKGQKSNFLFKLFIFLIVVGGFSAGGYYLFNLSKNFIGFQDNIALNYKGLRELDSRQKKLNKQIDQIRKELDGISSDKQEAIAEVTRGVNQLKDKIADLEIELIEKTEALEQAFTTNYDTEEDKIVASVEQPLDEKAAEEMPEKSDEISIAQNSEHTDHDTEKIEKITPPAEIETKKDEETLIKAQKPDHYPKRPTRPYKARMSALDMRRVEKLIKKRINEHIIAYEINRKKIALNEKLEEIRKERERDEKIVIAMEEVVKSIGDRLSDGFLFVKNKVTEAIR